MTHKLFIWPKHDTESAPNLWGIKGALDELFGSENARIDDAKTCVTVIVTDKADKLVREAIDGMESKIDREELTLKQAVTWAEFVARTNAPSPEFLASITRLARDPNTAGLILFENQMFGSSSFGDQKVACYGMSRTYRSPIDVQNGWLGDLPSQRLYPTVWVDTTDKATVTDIKLPEPKPLGNIEPFGVRRLDSYELELHCPFCHAWVKAWLPGVAANGKMCECGTKFNYAEGTAERNWQPAADATKVIFRRWPDGNRWSSDGVIAMFPELPGDQHADHCESYQHVGQHGAATVRLIDDTVPATPTEYADLVTELTSIGYDLDIRQRMTQQMHEKRRAALKRMG